MAVYPWCKTCEDRWEHCQQTNNHKDNRCYRADFRLGGENGQRIRKLYDTKADAESYERNTITDFERGIINPVLKGLKRTMSEACEHYKTVHLVPNKQYGDLPYVELYCKMFGPNTLLSQIDQDTCKKVFADLVERWQVQTVIRRWTTLVSIFRENRKWLKHNPAMGVVPKLMRKKAQRRKEVYFTDDQYFQLLKVAEELPKEWREDMKDIIIIFRHTGFRKGEGEKFSLEHIDFLTNTIHIPEQKNYEAASIPLLPETKARVREIMQRKGIKSGRILDLTNITERFRNLVKAAGLHKPYPNNLTLHSLRHSWGTYIQKNYKDINVTQKLMRHKDIKMTLRYAHAAQEMVRAAGIAGSAIQTNDAKTDIHSDSPIKQ